MIPIYVGAALHRAAFVTEIYQHFAAQATPTFDWTVYAGAPSPPSDLAGCMIAGVCAAQVVILEPGGRGSHVELGIALATTKVQRIWLLPDPDRRKPSDFYFAPKIKIVGSLNEITL